MGGVRDFMTVYTPDYWVVVFLGGPDPHYKVLAGWYGGYLGSDSWRLNSGVVEHDFDGDYWYFYGSSGSCYKCYVDSYRMSMVTGGVYSKLRGLYGDEVQLVEDQAWRKKGWDWKITK